MHATDCLKFAMPQDLLLHLDITLRQAEGVINTQRMCRFIFFYSRMHPFTLCFYRVRIHTS